MRTSGRTTRLCVAAAASLVVALALAPAEAQQPPIKIGLLEDISGDLALMGMPKLHGSQLAVEEINNARAASWAARSS